MSDPAAEVDVLVVALPTTAGWRGAVPALAAAIERAGARAAVATAGGQDPIPEVRTFMATDLVQARAARRAAVRGIAAHRPRALIYASATAALLGPRPGAIWFDSPAAQNRPGRHGLWQRPVERRRVAAAPLLLPMSEGGLTALDGGRARTTPAVVLPVPVEPSGPLTPTPERDVAALAYAADAEKKGLARILTAWRQARRAGETLLVAGQPAGPLGEGAEGTGLLPPREYRALLRRARAFVAAPRHEDFGIAQLEALADGCRLVTTPASGPYPALALARALDPRLVSDELAGAIRAALDAPDGDYAERAAALLAPYRQHAFETTVRERVLPALL
ncbi:MAG TPA: glycosyltransferase [Conexibacter sp.]|nr:glycosyltransferase [Conexibacter sp.]